MVERRYLPKPPDGNCFACGSTNQSGLRMEFFVQDGLLYSETHIRDEHQGWVEIAHGGIVSTILDETMSWAVLYYKRSFIVTRNMEVTFIRPLRINETYLCRAKVLEAEDPKEIRSQAVIFSKDWAPMARSIGKFRLLSKEEMKKISPRDLERMEGWFRLIANS